MAGFLAIKTDNRVTSRSKMVGLSAEATCAWLADVLKVNVVAVEPQETRDRTLFFFFFFLLFKTFITVITKN